MEEECWFSCEDEEEYKSEERKLNDLQLDSYSLPSFFEDDHVRIDNNIITPVGNNRWENCLIGKSVSEGVYKISLLVYGEFLLGMIDSSQRLSNNGKSITESHIGFFYGISFIYVITIFFIGIGVQYGLY